MTAGVGRRFPAYAVSMGRILLAALPAEQLEQYLATAEFAPLTPWTVTNPKALRKLITKVRRDGYIIVRDELDEGLEIGRTHVCTPVTNPHLVCRLLLEKKKHNTHGTRFH